MKNKALILIALIASFPFTGKSQNNTFSPFSRYGIGEMAQSNFAHNTAMGGANIALRYDSTMPVFLNVGNPASYAFIRLTVLEVGGSYLYSQFKENGSGTKKWGTNFAYASLGFPVRRNGGICLGLMPYSYVGYETSNTVSEQNIGNVQYNYYGDGGLNKAFIGYGVLPFDKRLVRFRSKHLYTPDSLRTLSHKQYLRREKLTKLVNDFSIGFNVNYIFGNVSNSARIIYPNSLTYNNTFRDRAYTMGDFTGNFGAQTGISTDSIKDHKGRKTRIEKEMKTMRALNIYSEAQLKFKRDSIDAVTPLRRRALKLKTKITFGYFMNLTNSLKASYSTGVYNYVLNGSGQEILRDTVLYNVNQVNSIRMPLEQGFGIGLKKGERLNIVADFAITNWQTFKFLDEVNNFKKSYRVSAGANFVPEKYAAGAGSTGRKINYRIGASYQTGYLTIKNNLISDYSVSLGIGLPVGIGRLSSMVNITGIYGIMGSSDPTLLKQNYWRVNFGFTFCDKWFQKYREN